MTGCSQSNAKVYVEPCATSIIELFYENIERGSKYNFFYECVKWMSRHCSGCTRMSSYKSALHWMCRLVTTSSIESTNYHKVAHNITNRKHQLPQSCSQHRQPKAPAATELLLWQFSKCLNKCSWCYLFLKKGRLSE